MEQPRPPSRVPAVDILRGAVMVLMALDHVRDYVTNLRFQPENLARGSAALFATRWVTHFCAPAFALLAGVGIGLSMGRGKPAGEMSRFLITRGLWLIVLDAIVTAIGFQFGFRLIPVFALVLWALGLSMIVMAALIHAPKPLVAAFALAMIAGHNLFDGVRPADWGAFAPLWNVLHVPGFAIPGKLLVAYPLIPWVGVMALGYVAADVYQWEPARRRRVLIGAGLAASALFIGLRAFNAYGNPFPWTVQRSAALTVASFLNVTKYPPSLQFLLMTLGPALVALALLERARGRVAGWLEVIGRVPLFFYVVHIYLAHLAGMTIAFVQSGEIQRIPVVTEPGAVPPWYGVPLPGVYLAWIVVVLAMYPLCRWYGRLKQRRDDWWLGYL
ncbi:MAG: heparan-alpha-glucosaminide N-acetyltransferase domain-containing protein [Acidobacteriota bacterium]|nr:heparan-alpha-glucosaminide N-acetyltransferase domain-containing protein [Acidobacteriota bacterium]